MRWKYYDNESAEEVAERADTLERINNWWRAFSEAKGEINACFNADYSGNFDLVQFMSDNLHAIHPSICWEFGPALNCDGHRLVITPEVDLYLSPMVDVVIARAPKLEEWEFYPRRVPEDMESAEFTIRGRTGGTLEGVKFALLGSRPPKIDVVFLSDVASKDERLASNVAFVALETLLGEDVLNKWIGSIDAVGDASAAKRWRDISELHGAVASAIKARQKSLPEAPLWTLLDVATYSNMSLSDQRINELKDEAALMDFPLRHDLAFGHSLREELWTSTRSSALQYDELHTNFDEMLCYLKLEYGKELEHGDVDARSEIEDSLIALLEPAKLGSVIGGGTGVRYAYIDLALADVMTALPLIRQVIQDRDLSHRAWLLFFSCELEDEWLGLFPDTPPPPERERE